MITSTQSNLEYGTILSVVRIHRNKKGYMATIAEGKLIPIYVPFVNCKDIT